MLSTPSVVESVAPTTADGGDDSQVPGWSPRQKQEPRQRRQWVRVAAAVLVQVNSTATPTSKFGVLIADALSST